MLFSTTSVLFAFSLISSATTQTTTCPTNPTCHTLHLFLARGNNEPYPGRQSALIASVCSKLPSNTTCGYEDLIYSALYTDLSCQTTYSGAIAGHVQLARYAEACPDSKLVLVGYSQGAQIVGDILGGGGGVSFNGCVQPETPGLARGNRPGSMVAAALTFGNTRHTASQPYNFGNGSAIDGLFPRPASQLASLSAYSSVLRDWCVESDPICAANQADSTVSTHLSYYDRYAQEAGEWIKSVVGVSGVAGAQTTTVPGSLSGVVQDYATIGTATPSGTVVLDTAWTGETSVVLCSFSSARSAVLSSSTSLSLSSASVSKSALSTSSATAQLSASRATTSSVSLAAQTTTSASTGGLSSSTSSAFAGVVAVDVFRISIVLVALVCL